MWGGGHCLTSEICRGATADLSSLGNCGAGVKLNATSCDLVVTSCDLSVISVRRVLLSSLPMTNLHRRYNPLCYDVRGCSGGCAELVGYGP